MEARYAVRFFGSASQASVLHFLSMAEMKEWVDYNNMLLGIPERLTAFFSAEHADGSTLTPEEFEDLKSVANREAYAEPQREVTGRSCPPEAGLGHAAVARFLQRGN